MGQITIICTRHEEWGNCNALQLLRIVETINPTVIFEELSLANFQLAYLQNNLETLETKTIKSYLVDNDIIQVPVDTFPRTRVNDEKVDCLNSKIGGGITPSAFHFRKLATQQEEFAGAYGFDFLNSFNNDELLNELDSLKMKILQELEDDVVNAIHREELQMIKDRETEILQNIYAFADNNDFKDAVMFIGSGHRRSIFPLIEKFEQEKKSKIIWRNYINKSK